MSTCGSKRNTKTKRHRIHKCATRICLRSRKRNKLLTVLKESLRGRINCQARNAIAMDNVGRKFVLITFARVCLRNLFVTIMTTATLNFFVRLLQNGPCNQCVLSIRKMASVVLKTSNAPLIIFAGTQV